jgi:hypothetical protein
LEGLPETVDLPFVGKVELEALSLPILTIVLGAMDGFNPCALWVLVFLISLLMNVKQRWRVWLLGAVFLLASGAVYFAFMAAWLNTVLLLSGLVWLRIGIGLLSIGAGAFFLREFWANPDSLCRVGDFNWRERIRSRLRKSIEATSLVLAILGIAAVAVLVNLVELFCSAGIPVVYSQVLAMSDLAAREYYLFLALYVFVFLLDDILIFILAMVTLQVVGLTAGVSRIAHLIGAILMSVLGLLLIFRPDLLAFI